MKFGDRFLFKRISTFLIGRQIWKGRLLP